jgi:hypothetical protein
MQLLQQLVPQFSGDGTGNMTLDTKFTPYTPVSVNDKVAFTAASLNAITLNTLLGNVQKRTTTNENQLLTFLDLMFQSNTKI